MTPEEALGARIGLVRRLLGVFEGSDLPIPAFAGRLGKDKKAGYRWERGQHRPPPAVVDQIVEMCVAAGLATVTAEWIERGRGGTAALGELLIPESALDTNYIVEIAAEEEPVPTAPVSPVLTHAEQRAAAKKKTVTKRRARGGE